MKLTITINCDNDAFADGNTGTELARILRKLATAADGETSESLPGVLPLTLRDVNGNRVGECQLES